VQTLRKHPSRDFPILLFIMGMRTGIQIEAEIEALRARIRRLRLERKADELASNERRLMQVARTGSGETGKAEPNGQDTLVDLPP
jgi:hypothetical protein